MEACTHSGVPGGRVGLTLAFVLACSATALGRQPAVPGRHAAATLQGRVVGTDGAPVGGIAVRLEDAARKDRRETVTAADGTFRFDALMTPGDVILVVEGRGGPGLVSARQVVPLLPGNAHDVTLRLALRTSEQITVTDTGEQRLKRETPAAVETLDRDAIDAIRPIHPGQLLGQVPGVWVSATSGEGHMTAIRQPLTTSPVYLYLEDGVPTRSTGFFNHNALYEVNVPAAAGVEVTRGPGSALYGSDAIGGVVNVLSRSGFEAPGAVVDAEAGAWGWARLTAGAGLASSDQALRADVNLTRTDGWRDATAYDRQTGTLRWDRVLGGGAASLKTLGTFTHVDQQTAGSAVLSEEDYLARPRLNLTPISFRTVRAFRLSTEYQRASGSMLLSVLPYFRYNSMNLLPNWSITYDPTEYTTSNTSYGVAARVRRDLAPMRSRIVAGLDAEASPGGRIEHSIEPRPSLDEQGRRIFDDYATGAAIYDYTVRFTALSPFVHAELSPSPRLRVNAGLRADFLGYTYDDQLATPDTSRYRRPADATRQYRHVSPKLGVTWSLSDVVNLFGGYRHAFRVPSEGQLFRQGSAANTIDLDPVRADNLEAGVRAVPWGFLSVDASVYRLDKRDDILTWRNPVDGSTEARNAGRTSHQGVELAVDARPHPMVTARASWTWARHRYEAWLVDPAGGLAYDGRTMETAPTQLTNVFVAVAPGRTVSGSFEVVRVGEYWLDAANTQTYAGHTLLNLRAAWRLRSHAELFARLLNATDERYAEASSYTLARGRELAPGLPRAVYAGLRLEWTR